MCLTCSALSWRGLCARLKRVLSTNRDNSAVRSKHVFCVCADSLYRSSQDGESDSSFLFPSYFLLISFLFPSYFLLLFILFFYSSLSFFYIHFISYFSITFYFSSISFDFTFLLSILFLIFVQYSLIHLNLSSNFFYIRLGPFLIFY